MDKPASPNENAARRRWAADQIEMERGAAKWCRRFVERLSDYPSRPDLEIAIRVFQRTANKFDASAGAFGAIFEPAPEPTNQTERKIVASHRVPHYLKRSKRETAQPAPQPLTADAVARLMGVHQQAWAVHAQLMEDAQKAVRKAEATRQEAVQVLEPCQNAAPAVATAVRAQRIDPPHNDGR